MRRAVALVASVATPILALGGCVIHEGSGRSAEDARTELDDTEQTAGGEWENQDDPTSRGCVIPLWVEGEMYPGLRIGTPPRDIPGTLDAVVHAWADWGYSVRQTRVGDVVELQGRNTVQELIVFRVSAEGMTLQGESECRPTAA
jgi:hypothetical protein